MGVENMTGRETQFAVRFIIESPDNHKDGNNLWEVKIPLHQLEYGYVAEIMPTPSHSGVYDYLKSRAETILTKKSAGSPGEITRIFCALNFKSKISFKFLKSSAPTEILRHPLQTHYWFPDEYFHDFTPEALGIEGAQPIKQSPGRVR